MMVFVYGTLNAQETEQTKLLSTLIDGPWLCAYYLLNSNDELADLSSDKWAGRCVDEEEWVQGVGPLSNSLDQFMTTEWGSQLQPILVRRHFALTKQQVEELQDKTIVLTCSYDENPSVYLNGRLIWNASGWNDNDYDSFVLIPRQKKLFVEGDNVLAVSLKQGGGGGHIDYGLYFNGSFSTSGICDVVPEQQSRQCFNLSGQPVDVPGKGISIVRDGTIAKKIIRF
ncbi:hypothetical protein [Xylanibacter brevis]|uniref:hypothetical protein n=1 Tax=Xylanibacter brevis TaxID=83231 RepID=UPI0012DE52A9|nr:hypothetical protein [Xylanibacter brevis]